jgi:hypothetical protein
MRHANSSLPFALVLAAAVQTPGTILPDMTNTSLSLQPGLLSPLLDRAAAIGSDQPFGNQRVTQRFLNFTNCSSGRRC